MKTKKLKSIDLIVREVSELPNRTSPDDQPDMMLVSAEELEVIVSHHFELYEGLLIFALYHHQGGKSPVGQPIRKALGMRDFEDISEYHMDKARRSLSVLNSQE